MGEKLNAAVEYICLRETTLTMMFVGSILGLLLNVLSLSVVQSGSITSVVVLLNFVGLIALGIFSGGMIWYCYQE